MGARLEITTPSPVNAAARAHREVERRPAVSRPLNLFGASDVCVGRVTTNAVRAEARARFARLVRGNAPRR
jgi:hypothetical protein